MIASNGATVLFKKNHFVVFFFLLEKRKTTSQKKNPANFWKREMKMSTDIGKGRAQRLKYK